MPHLRKCSQLCAGQVSDLTAVLSCKDNGIRDRRRLNASAERENPAREEVRRASETDWQPGGGGVTSPTKNAGRRSASFDALTIQQARSKNSRYFAPQHCACRMAGTGCFAGRLASPVHFFDSPQIKLRLASALGKTYPLRMSLESVRQFFSTHAPDVEVVVTAESSATVPLAAVAHGVRSEQIAKTICVKAGEAVALVVMAGTARLDNRKFRDRFGVKPRMLGG
jgi:Aminoacyl-tRNA editing domain